MLGNLNIVDEMKFSNAVAATAAGTTEIDCGLLDTQGFLNNAVMVLPGAIVSGAATSVKWKHGDLADGSDLMDVAGSGLTILDTHDGGIFVSEIVKPLKRYAKAEILRATQNATIDRAVYIQGRAFRVPVTQDATVKGTEILFSPVDGTP